jgi:hypothetical protein
MEYQKCELLWTNERDGKNMSIIMCFQESAIDGTTISYNFPIINGNLSKSNKNISIKNNKSEVLLNNSLNITPSFSPSSVFVPIISPSVFPSVVPSVAPSVVPSVVPSVAPSVVPSAVPSTVPSMVPSTVPSVVPSTVPSVSSKNEIASINNTTAIPQLIILNSNTTMNKTDYLDKKVESNGEIITLSIVSTMSVLLFIIFGILIIKRKKKRVLPCTDKNNEMVKKEPKQPKRIDTKPNDYLIEVLTDNPPSPKEEVAPKLPPRINNIERIKEINRKLKVLRALKKQPSNMPLNTDKNTQLVDNSSIGE